MASWRRGFDYCHAKNRDGRPCGNKVPTTPSGVFIRGRYCHVHSCTKREAARSEDGGESA